MKKEYTISINLYDSFVRNTNICFMAGNSETMLININLLSSDKPFELLSGDKVELVFENTLGSNCVSYADIVDYKTGKVSYEPTACQVACVGDVLVTATVIRGTKRISWHGFKYTVSGNNCYAVCANSGEAAKSCPAIHVGDNGNWWIDDTDTGRPSKGEDGTPGEKGEKGENGESAYEIWLKNGNNGSEQDFINWLKDGNAGGNVENTVSNTGEIFWWPLKTPPPNSLFCDGSQKSRTEYAELFNVIGESFGAGDGAATFNLPDLRGEFIRGYDPGATRDPEGKTRGIGRHQEATQIPNMFLYTTSSNKQIMLPYNKEADKAISVTNADGGVTGTAENTVPQYTTMAQSNTSSVLNRTIATRPTNVNLLPCIRC